MADAPNPNGATRTSRAFTLPSHSPVVHGDDFKAPVPSRDTVRAQHQHSTSLSQPRHHHHHHPHRPHRHHRQHRSQQIGARDHPSGSGALSGSSAMPSASAQISELFGPVRSAATNLSGLGVGSGGGGGGGAGGKTANASAAGSQRGGSLEPGTRGKDEAERARPWKPDPSWADIRRARARNKKAEEHLRTSYTHLVSSTSDSASSLRSLHASLDGTLAATRILVSQLSALQRSAARHLDKITTSSLPGLAEESSTRLAALRRAHAANSRTQLATLEARVNAAAERSATYQRRVKMCADRAAVHEEREKLEVKRHKARVGVLWAVVALLLAAWLAAAAWKGKERIESQSLGRMKRQRLAGNEQLRSVLRDKGVEWPLTEEASVEPTVRYTHGSGSLGESRASTRVAAQEDGRLERMFESL